MRVTEIKKQLHDYIDTADDKKLKAIYTLVEDEISYSGYLTKEQLEEAEQRMADHDAGIGRTYTWEETIEMARNAVKNNAWYFLPNSL